MCRSPVVLQARQFSSAGDFVEKCPSLGDSISEGTVVSWEVQIGDYVNKDDVICVMETDKVSVEIHATASGELVSYFAEEGDTVEVDHDLISLDTTATPSAKAAPAAAAPAAAEPAAPAAPKADAPAPPQPAPAAPKAAEAAAPAAAVSEGPSRGERVVKMSRMRQTIARRLKESQNTAALLTTFNEIDMSGIMNLRTKHKDEFLAKHGVKLGFMSIFSKASAAALLKYPDTNAFFDQDNKQIVYRDYVDISVAVGTPTGLVTPVIRNVESMSFADVEGSIGALGKKARDGQITLEDLTGGTFTISNGGVYGSLMGTPILNPPQSAILGMHGIFKRPVVVGNEIEIRPMMYVALTYDHRVIDGGTAVGTLKTIKELVEDPSRLLLDL